MPRTTKDDALNGEFQFTDFTTAFAFMTEVAFTSEPAGHQPEWSNVYKFVNIRRATYNVDNAITDKGHSLAATTAKIHEKYV